MKKWKKFRESHTNIWYFWDPIIQLFGIYEIYLYNFYHFQKNIYNTLFDLTPAFFFNSHIHFFEKSSGPIQQWNEISTPIYENRLNFTEVDKILPNLYKNGKKYSIYMFFALSIPPPGTLLNRIRGGRPSRDAGFVPFFRRDFNPIQGRLKFPKIGQGGSQNPPPVYNLLYIAKSM